MGTTIKIMLAHIHIHPIIVHFPIALFISAMGCEVLGLVFKKEILRKTVITGYYGGRPVYEYGIGVAE